MATYEPRRPRPRRSSTRHRRRRLVAALVLLVVVAGVAAYLLSGSSGSSGPNPDADRLQPGSGPGQGIDPLRYTPARARSYALRATEGEAHALYAKSIGGVAATAARVAALRPQIEAATKGTDVDPDVLEGIVFLESGGRPDALASNDLHGAVGVTQILAQTATDLLGMKVDVAKSTRLTKLIAKGGKKTAARVRLRARIDQRFDVARSLAGTVTYLEKARKELGGSSELAVVSYHMGIGNLQTALKKYGQGDVPYVQLYFDTSPIHHASAFAFLSTLGDDSSTYLWRVRAAEQIMAEHAADPAKLAAKTTLELHKNSAEEVLRPQATTPTFAAPADISSALAGRALLPLRAAQLARYGWRIDAGMGSLAARVGQSKRLYRALTPDALAVLLYLGAGVQGISGTRPLVVTSSVRDAPYQKLLTAQNIEATKAYSLHTTGNAFDFSRTYRSTAQAQATQFMLDRLTALNVIAWVREPAAIHVTAGPLARQLLPLLRPGAPTAVPVRSAAK
jgi:hypothetical protein